MGQLNTPVSVYRFFQNLSLKMGQICRSKFSPIIGAFTQDRYAETGVFDLYSPALSASSAYFSYSARFSV
jgi:hypothetical protein